MQNSVFCSQKQSKPINNIEIVSPQALALDRISQKVFHRTTWNHIMLHQQAKEKKKEDAEDSQDEDEDENEEEYDETRWIRNQKMLKLHNWKYIQASVSLPYDLSPVKAIHFFREQNHCMMKQLTVHFDGANSFGIYKLGTLLSCLTHRQIGIQDLSLKITRFLNIKKPEINLIRRILLKNLPNLRSLKWSQCFGALGKDTKIIASQITKRMTHLKSLFFNFGGIKLQDNETLPSIVRDITRNVPSLEKLVLYFWGSSRVSNDEFKQFAEQICRNLTGLKYLHLNFRSCESLGPACLQVLSKEISEHLLNLRMLILIFDCCSEITSCNLDTLKHQLSKNLPKLKYLSYNDEENASNELERLQR